MSQNEITTCPNCATSGERNWSRHELNENTVLACDTCGYLPKKWVRDEIMKVTE